MKSPLPALVLALLAAAPVEAATLLYVATPLGGDDWRYDYLVTNDEPDSVIREFTVYFAVGSYANLAVAGAEAGWDALVVQPDAGLPAAGFYDALAIGAGLASGGSLQGFAVTFDYLGPGSPGSQPFEIVDPVSFAPLFSGLTAEIPLPGTAWLLGVGMTAVVARARRRSKGRVVPDRLIASLGPTNQRNNRL